MQRFRFGGAAEAAVILVLCAGAGSASAQVQDRQQQKCLKAMSKALALVAAAQHGNGVDCLTAAAKGELPSGQSAQECLTVGGGELPGAIATGEKFADKRCSPEPDFGFPGVETVIEAGQREDRGLLRDLWGDDLDASVIDAATNPNGATCQASVAKIAGKTLKTAFGVIAACESAGLKAETIDDATDLAACARVLASDPEGKLINAVGKLAKVVGAKCTGVTLDDAFPGACDGSGNFAGCIGERVRCRACLASSDGIQAAAECDTADDDELNGSCCPDADDDGFGACAEAAMDCDDTDPDVHPGADELCDAADNDCNGDTDDFTIDVGEVCGQSDVAPCAKGTAQCVSGALICTGEVDPTSETCNDIDDDCDGVADDGVTGSECRVPAVPPDGATSACQSGTQSCDAGAPGCDGATGPSDMLDGCNVDANCDGQLESTTDTLSDSHNCGSCGNACGAGKLNSLWACMGGNCSFTGCQAGFFDHIGNDQNCETACTFVSTNEICNGSDDDCDGLIDEGVVAPTPAQVCGVTSASRAECSSGVSVACVNGSWSCTFPAGVCSGGCSENDEICDGLDNDCDGHLNENVMNYGAACASDDGLPAPGHGLCRTTGTFVCNGNHALACSAVKADCSTLAGGCTEVCDGLDNDCDGSVDETFNAKGANATHFVKPVVTKIASALWIYSYEASRPSATAVISGTGNGYWTSAPSGETLDKTVACSASGKIPWFNVSPQEVEQVCTAMGGAICTVSQWQSACTTNPPSGVTCRWGYNPRGSSCTATRNGSKFCNIAPYDFSGAADGDQDGLLPTASASLQNCWADWSGLLGNTGSSAKISDVTGNVREITKEATNVYRLMGGGFSGDSEDGSECGFTFYGVDQFFKYFDTGFRCCFTSDPTL